MASFAHMTAAGHPTLHDALTRLARLDDVLAAARTELAA
jgi:hypothetical protein